MFRCLYLAALLCALSASATLGQVLRDTLPAGFPSIVSVYDSSRVAEGALFFSNFQFSGKLGDAYLIIATNDGTPLFYRPVTKAAFDFRVQPNGLLTYVDNVTRKYYAMDSNYVVVDSFWAGNDETTDVHDLRLLPNGHFVLLTNDTLTEDLSHVVSNGSTDAKLLGNSIQELDQNRNVVFTWRGLDHFNVEDARLVDLEAQTIDMEHSNSIDIDTDGNFILSSRTLDEVTKINRTTGEIMWRFGGAHNQFRLIGDTLWFSHQHDVRRIANGDITLFDNGNGHEPQFSRALEYRLNTDSMTATLVWSYAPEERYYSQAMGSVQRLPNGNTLIGYGDVPERAAEEIAPDGTRVFYLAFPNGYVSYRFLRQPWRSAPPLSVPMSQVLHDEPLSVFPSPVSKESMVYFGLDRAGSADLTLYDACGRVARSLATGEFCEGHHSTVLEAAGLASGTYHLILRTSAGVTAVNLPIMR